MLVSLRERRFGSLYYRAEKSWISKFSLDWNVFIGRTLKPRKVELFLWNK
jgi:hypothetical protein